MTWEETIQQIRQKPEFNDLVRDAYFDSNLKANVERYKEGEEFRETLNFIKTYAPDAKVIADIGSGNGIATIALALKGYEIYSVEPDPSSTIGAGAVRRLAGEYQLEQHVKVLERFGEDTGIENSAIDVVYIRQAMHHAHNLKNMMREAYRILKPGGLLFTVRDHVIYDDADKAWFLEMHPLHKFYGGENAFTELQYKDAMQSAGLSIIKMFRHYESVINYYPIRKSEMEQNIMNREASVVKRLKERVGPFASVSIVQRLYKKLIGFKMTDERLVPGRLYTFLARKPL